MRICSVTVHRFRGYEAPVTVQMERLCVLVGRNDIGKSTFLEALDIFFNEGAGCVKLDKDDINKACLAREEDCVEIGVEFADLPPQIIIDATNATSLRDAYLLTERGTLSVVKRFAGAGRERVFVKAMHPTNPACRDLLQKKIAELRKMLDDQGLECVDKTKSAELRKAIWGAQPDLQLQECEIEIAKVDAKGIWEQLKLHMPLYTLFQSDRKNEDSDDEVQDPMRIAVKEILSDREIQHSLAAVADTVKARLEEVAARTKDKLAELNPRLATTLTPKIPEASSLQWADVFKSLSITGDDEIPINKRGSGVKRLVLISFFRAEAERRRAQAGLPNVVYAIEEPETSQHPEHQRALTNALVQLSRIEGVQVLLTTHSPEVVKRLRFEDLVLVSGRSQDKVTGVLPSELPYPSLNEINFVAFDEASFEYHNELYGFIESEEILADYLEGKPKRQYVRLRKNGAKVTEEISLTEYIRHQIHHPENTLNEKFSPEELADSIRSMRDFCKNQQRVGAED